MESTNTSIKGKTKTKSVNSMKSALSRTDKMVLRPSKPHKRVRFNLSPQCAHSHSPKKLPRKLKKAALSTLVNFISHDNMNILRQVQRFNMSHNLQPNSFTEMLKNNSGKDLSVHQIEKAERALNVNFQPNPQNKTRAKKSKKIVFLRRKNSKGYRPRPVAHYR